MVQHKDTDIKLYSFDVFDTLITRKVAKPVGIFVLMQRVINNDEKFKDFPKDLKANFVNYRTNAIYYQRRLKHTQKDLGEVSFDAVYRHIQETFLLTESQTELLKQLEIDIEISNCVPITANIEKVKELYNSGKKVILISDMYLPINVVNRMLQKIDPIFDNIKLYLSSETGCMKSSGEAFKYVKEKENIEYNQWQHVGDNSKVDIKPAKALGINAVLYKYVDLKTYEKRLLKIENKNPYVQLTIGCAKNVRLNKFPTNKKGQLGASLAAGILYPYISWVLNQSVKRGIKHLFFIARDGYIPKLMADEIIKIKNLDISTSYIYGSRKAWKNSGIENFDDSHKQTFIQSCIGNNVSEVSIASGLSEDEILSLLPIKFRKYKCFNAEQKKEIFSLFNKDNSFMNLISEKNKENRNNALNYLKQEIGEYWDKKFGFVDIDGSGLTNSSMGNIIKDFVKEKPVSFYLASTPFCHNSEFMDFCYFYALKKGGYGYILESFVRAPHGQTLGYQQKDDLWQPILEKIDEQVFTEWEYDKYVQGIIEFTKEFTYLVCSNDFKYFCEENQSVMDYYIKFVTTSVDEDTAKLISGISRRFQSNVFSDEWAPIITIKDALRFILFNKIETENIMYSKLRSSSLVQQLISWKQNIDSKKGGK